jgi:hypothetical protein
VVQQLPVKALLAGLLLRQSPARQEAVAARVL